jgi:hypothetical protein
LALATFRRFPDLLKAVSEASGKAFALWVTFLTAGVYLAISIGRLIRWEHLLYKSAPPAESELPISDRAGASKVRVGA